MDQRGILKEINNKLNQLEIKTEYTKNLWTKAILRRKFILNPYIRKEEGSQINKFPPQKN